MRELVTAPVDELRLTPSGKGGKSALVLTENVYGGEPPVAEIVQPA